MNYIGIDLGGTNIAAGIVNENGNIIYKRSVKTDVKGGAEKIVKDMAGLCTALVKDAGFDFSDIEFCGIASPGIADNKSGRVEYANNLPFYRFPIADLLKSYIPVKRVGIDNDANAAAKGEAVVGAAKGYDNSVMITLGTGVGGVIIIDRKVYSGFNFAGAELGHMVIERGGRQCTCGRKGCWEAYSSATGLIETTKEFMEKDKKSIMWEICGDDIGKVNGRTAFDGMRKNDKTASDAVGEYIGYLACGITNIVNIFEPEILSIGGGISNEGDTLLNPLKKLVEMEQYPAKTDIVKTKLVIARLRNDAGIIGAAMLGV